MIRLAPTSDVHGTPRTPQALAREAIEQSRAAKTNVEAMRAITMAIVALAGEVHALTDGGVSLKVETLPVRNIDVEI